MKRNLVVLLIVVTVVGVFVRWKQPTSQILVTETTEVPLEDSPNVKETRINTTESARNRGYKVDSINLGANRETADAVNGRCDHIQRVQFPNGIRGQFPVYLGPDHNRSIAYDLNNRVYCLTGRELTLPSGERVPRHSLQSAVLEKLGTPTDLKEEGSQVVASYPEIGLTCTFAPRYVGREREWDEVFLSLPWAAGKH